MFANTALARRMVMLPSKISQHEMIEYLEIIIRAMVNEG